MIKDSGHLRTLKKCRNTRLWARGFHIFLVSLNARSDFSQRNTYGGPYLQTQQTILETQQNIFETQLNICETQTKIIETQHKIVETQHKIVETQHKIIETQHKVVKTQQKIIETTQNIAGQIGEASVREHENEAGVQYGDNSRQEDYNVEA